MGRISVELREKVAATQEKVMAALQIECKAIACVDDPSNRLAVLTDCDDQQASRKFGAAGQILRRFATSVSNHPDVADYNRFSEWKEFVGEVSGAVKADYVEGLHDRLNKVYSPIVRNMAHIKPRVVGDPLKRNDLREVKRQIKNVGMKFVYMMGENGFYGRPNNFDSYVRNSAAYLEEVEGLKKQHEVFTTNGMSEVAHAVKKRRFAPTV